MIHAIDARSATLRVLLALVVATAVGCSTGDQATPGPAGYDVTDGSGNGDIDGGTDSAGGDTGGVDAKPAVTLDFTLTVSSANGPVEALQGASSVILSLSQDLYPGTADSGFQGDVKVTSTGLADGTKVNVTVGGVSAGEVTLQGGTATLQKVTIKCATVAQELAVSAPGADTVTKGALVNCGNACTATLSQPPTCITQDADPVKAGFQVAVEVSTTTPDCTHAYVKYTDAEGSQAESVKVPLSGGKATVVFTASNKDSGLANATAQVQAVVEDQAHVDRPEGTSAQATLKLTTDAPVVALLQPTALTLTLADDANGNAADGIQVNLVGTATSMQPLDPITILVDGVDGGASNIAADGTSFQKTLTFKTTGTYKVSVSAKNSCGLSGSAEKSFGVFADKSALAISKPAAGAILLAKDDGDAKTPNIYETTMEVTTSGAPAGTTVSVFCRANQVGATFGANPVGKAVLPSGAAGVAVAVALDVSVLTSNIVCRASDDGPNASQSSEVGFTAALPAPCLVISQPTAGQVVTTASLAVAVTATNLNGAVVEAKIAVLNGGTVIDTLLAKVSNDASSGNVALATGTPPKSLPDGSYQLTVSAKDSSGNNAGDSACSDVTRSFVVDTKGPGLKISVPTKSSLDPLVDPDADAATLGYQTTVVVDVTGETGTSSVCLSVNGFTVPCQTVVGEGKATFTGVTLQAGDNKLLVTGSDASGNKTANPAFTLTYVSNAVVVVWDDPKTSVVTAKDTLSVRAKVTEQKSGAVITGAKVAVYVDGKIVPGATVSEAPGGLYTTVITGLKAGKNTVQFSVTPASGGSPGVSPLLDVTRKVGTPTVAITSPANNKVFLANDTACTGGQSSCSTTATVTTSNAEDGSKVTIEAKCAGNKATSVEATVSGGKASASGLVLANNTTCSISATVTDLAGQSATGTAISVQVDLTKPKIVGLNPAKVTLLANDDVDSNSSNGMQYLLNVFASGLAKDAPITVDVYADDGSKKYTYTSKPHAAIPDNGTGSVGFGAVDIPDGDAVKLVFSTKDTAGNTATLTLTLAVLAASPDIRISLPANVPAIACKGNSDCAQGGLCTPSGKCALPWSKASSQEFLVVANGSLAGAKARICSNSSAIQGGSACATIGYKQVGQVVDVNSGANSVSVTGVADGDHTFIAEMLPAGGDASKAADWVNSTSTSAGDVWKSRAIYVDTTPPSLASVLPKSVAGVPTSCLNGAMEVKPDAKAGGVFSLAATLSNEEATVKVFSSGTAVGSASTTNKVAGVSVTLPEGSAKLTAVATDLVGNESAATVVGTYTVDTLSPAAQFSAPNKSPLLVGDSLDIQVSSPATDVEGQPVVLKDAGKTVGTLAMKSGVATFTQAAFKTLTDGSHTLTATLTDKCANESVASTVPATVVVDTAAPTVTITTPAQAAALKDDDDASANASGYQVSVAFNTTGAAKWSLELGTDCDAKFENCAAFSPVSNGDVTNDGGAEPAQLATLSFGKTTNYVARVTVTDANGNKTSADRGFTVSLSGCLVSLSGLPSNGVINTTSCATKGSNCAATTLDLKADFKGPCGNVTSVTLEKAGKVVATKSPSQSEATFSVSFADGEDATYEAKAIAGGSAAGSSGAQKVLVDLTNPVVTFEKGTVLGFETSDGKATAVYGTGSDQDQAQNGVQVHALLRVKDANLTSAQVTKLQNTASGTGVDLTSGLKLPFTIGGTTSKDIEIKFVTLPDNATAKVTATVVDGAGNTGTATFDATADTLAPGAVTLTPLTSADINPRRPFAKLTATATGDDGTSGKAAKYEVRYSKSDITSTSEFEAACDASQLPSTKLATPSDAGKTDTLIVEGPDPRASTDACKFAPLTDAAGAAKYYFAARAVDDAGNAGPVSASVSTADIRLRYTKVTATSAPWKNGFGFGFVAEVGDVNGDGKGDIAYGGFLAPHFCVVYGQADNDGKVPATINVDSASSANHVCLTGTSAIGSRSAGPIDVNGDGVHDLVVDYGQKSKDNADREVRVYLGESGKALTTTPAVTISGITSAASYGVHFLGNAGNFNGDKTAGGNAIQDIVVTTSPTSSAAYYRVMVIPGSAAWTSSSPITINVGTPADRKKHNVVTFSLASQPSSGQFGTTVRGVGNMFVDGDGSGTQYDDLLIGKYNDVSAIWLIKGRATTGDTSLTYSQAVDGSGNDEKNAVVIRPDVFTGGGNFHSGFPVSFDGDAIPDLLVSHRDSGKPAYLYWLRGVDLAKFLGKVAGQGGTQVGSSGVYKTSCGWFQQAWVSPAIPLGNFGDQQGTASVAVGGGAPSNAPTGSTNFSVRLPQVRTDGVTGNIASYHVEDLTFQNPYNPGSKTMGVFATAPAGDFNGDGYPDVMIGTFGGTDYSILVY